MTAVRKLPDQGARIETGVTQFGDDWPGVFIRGDNAYALAGALEGFLKDQDIAAMEPMQAFNAGMVHGLIKLLRSCDVRNLNPRSPGADADASASAPT